MNFVHGGWDSCPWDLGSALLKCRLLISLCCVQEVPDPIKYFVTRWSTEPWIQMAYSFVKTCGSGEAYDIIAEEIQGAIFFAGEVRILMF